MTVTLLPRPAPAPLPPVHDDLLDLLIDTAEDARLGRGSREGAEILLHAMPTLLRELRAHRRARLVVADAARSLRAVAANVAALPEGA